MIAPSGVALHSGGYNSDLMSRLHSSLVVGLSRVWLSLGLVFALTAALLMGLASPAGAVAGYGDVPEDTWYTDPVQWSTDNNITGIAGPCFAPRSPVSRGETAVWIYNMENKPAAGDRHSFTDVTDASQHDAISWMDNNEITTGTSTTTFAPDETLTRAQAATFLHRLKGEPSAPPHNFSDVVAGWQQNGVSWMAHTGITTGTSPTTFAPNDTLTRAQLITFLYRYKNKPDVTLNTSTPLCAPIGAFKAVSAGGGHSCGIRTSDTITCWGFSWRVEWQVDEPTGGFKAVSAGGDHSCGVRTDDTITCWGDNQYGQVDAPTGSFKAVSAGGSHNCAIRTDDTITCWGDNQYGRVDAPTGSFKAVSAGGWGWYGHSCGVRTDDTITCWGDNPDNQYGQVDAPTGSFKAVSAGGSHNCAIRTDDTITCWGNNQYGQVDAPTGSFKAVSAGDRHNCAIRTDDTITCWGSNFNPGLGDDFYSGQADAPAGGFEAVNAGYGHSCGVRTDDTITCWGDSRSWKADTGG